jgi:hypothetical protein
MTDDNDDHPLDRYLSSRPPAVRPIPTMPALPSSSGAFSLSRTSAMRKDTAFVESHTELLKAKRGQTDAMTALIESRVGAALAMAKISALPEIAHHAYQRGRAERTREVNDWEHQGRVSALDRQRTEADAKTALLFALQRLADAERGAPEPPPVAPSLEQPPTITGLTPDDVEDVLSHLPEIPPETLETIRRLLAGFLKEKGG